MTALALEGRHQNLEYGMAAVHTTPCMEQSKFVRSLRSICAAIKARACMLVPEQRVCADRDVMMIWRIGFCGQARAGGAVQTN
jgi:hypothetical protein